MNAQSVFTRAVLAEREGRYDEALQLFQTCLGESEIDQGEVLFHCGWCIEQGESDPTRALHQYELAAAETSVPECRLNSFFRAGWLLMHQKEYPKAANLFRHAIDYGDVSQHMNETYTQSVFWYAVCLESQGRYIEAMKWYRLARLRSPQLDPESRVREIACLNNVGAYDEALTLCQTFDQPAPVGFHEKRYYELRAIALGERAMLLQCLCVRSYPTIPEASHGLR